MSGFAKSGHLRPEGLMTGMPQNTTSSYVDSLIVKLPHG